MQLLFIRHAQSSNNALFSSTGSDRGRSEDPELTKIGVQQASRLADFLAQGAPRGGSPCTEKGNGFGINFLYCSLMLRSVQTGSIIARRLHLPLYAWEELHERGGIYLEDPETRQIQLQAGKSREYFASHFPELRLPEDFPEVGWWNFRPHEPPKGSMERAGRFLAGLLDKHGGCDDRVAVVSHGGFYNDFLDTLLHLPGSNGTWFSMYNTAVTRIDFHDEIVELVYQNRIDFMPKELVT